MFKLTLADDGDVCDAMTTIKNQLAEKWAIQNVKKENGCINKSMVNF